MSLPYFPMYPTDFEADTSHLTLAEDGAYNRLLRLCWMTPGCSLPDDEAWIMRRMRARTDEEQEAVRVVLAEFFTLSNGRLSNARLTRENIAAKEAHEKRKNAGSKGGAAKSAKTNKKAPSKAKAMPKQPEPEPEPENNTPKPPNGDDGFADFYGRYPRKVGKDAARRAWAKAVKRAPADQIIAGLVAQLPALAARELRFQPHPSTWLNEGRWQDEPAGRPLDLTDQWLQS